MRYNSSKILLPLLFTFVRVGAFTFGGGYAMLPLIHRDVVEKKKWLTENEFLDLFAVAQSLPGVFAVNMSIFIGHRLCRWKGSIVAALGTIFPSFVVILLLALFFRHIQDNPWVMRIMSGIRPAVVALIAAPVLTTWRAMKVPKSQLWIPIASALLVWFMGVSPVYIIIGAAVGGLLYTLFIERRIREKIL